MQTFIVFIVYQLAAIGAVLAAFVVGNLPICTKKIVPSAVGRVESLTRIAVNLRAATIFVCTKMCMAQNGHRDIRIAIELAYPREVK